MVLVVKNPPANAGDTRDSGSIPGLGRPHMPRDNSARVPQLLSLSSLEPVLHNKKSQWSEKPVHHDLRKPTYSNRVLAQPKIKLRKKIKTRKPESL